MKLFFTTTLLGFSICVATAQDKPATEPASNASAPTSSAQDKTPPLSMPRLASIQVRVTGKEFVVIDKARTDRDAAIQKVLSKELKGRISPAELLPLSHASTAIFDVCNIGNDYIQWRLKQNGKWSGLVSFFSGLTGVGAAASGILNTSKGLGLTSAALQNYNTGVAENGDAGHNTTQLKKIQEDVRFELATGINNFNRALLMPSVTEQDTVNQYRHLQAAVLEMNNACAFF
jgi:hypothetical protein